MSETGDVESHTIECPSCGALMCRANRFCGACGSLLVPALTAGLQREVERLLAAKFQDAKIVEIEISQAIVARLTDWAKLFAFLIGVPLAISTALLGYFGFHAYSDFAASVKKAKEEALRPLEKTKEEATQQYNELEARLKQNQGLGCASMRSANR